MDGQIQTVEISALEYGFGGLVTVCLTVFGWLCVQLIQSIRELRRDLEEMDRSHTDYKLEAEKRFAKSEDVNDSFENLNRSINVMQTDIKNMAISMATLAAGVKNKN